MSTLVPDVSGYVRNDVIFDYSRVAIKNSNMSLLPDTVDAWEDVSPLPTEDRIISGYVSNNTNFVPTHA